MILGLAMIPNSILIISHFLNTNPSNFHSVSAHDTEGKLVQATGSRHMLCQYHNYIYGLDEVRQTHKLHAFFQAFTRDLSLSSTKRNYTTKFSSNIADWGFPAVEAVASRHSVDAHHRNMLAVTASAQHILLLVNISTNLN
jgi:hypothetical protein